jgi:NADH-quinone oxidoreductase subunit K
MFFFNPFIVGMFLSQLSTNIVVYIIGIIGALFNYRNILIILMCIELILLSITLNFIVFSTYLDDFYGQIFSIFILTVAAAESAIGLAVLILYYRIRGNISITQPTILKG